MKKDHEEFVDKYWTRLRAYAHCIVLRVRGQLVDAADCVFQRARL